MLLSAENYREEWRWWPFSIICHLLGFWTSNNDHQQGKFIHLIIHCNSNSIQSLVISNCIFFLGVFKYINTYWSLSMIRFKAVNFITSNGALNDSIVERSKARMPASLGFTICTMIHSKLFNACMLFLPLWKAFFGFLGCHATWDFKIQNTPLMS